MTKIMAITIVPVLALGLMLVTPNEGPSQDAKSVAIDATHAHYQSTTDLQRRRSVLISRATRSAERIAEKERRARAKARAEAQAKREQAAQEAEAEAATQAATRVVTGGGSNNLPALLLLIRSHESGGDYHAYNATGCLGGCYGAYQMTAEYMDDWAREAGYPDYAYVGFWPASVQDAVALYKFNQTGGALWCDWTDYC